MRGWDLRKALKLFRKSNPSLMEWLASPIVYREVFTTASVLRKLSKSYCSQEASGYYYLNTARRRFRQLSVSNVVLHKKYLYVLRPILAINWLETQRGDLPAEFRSLVRKVVAPGALRDEINVIVEQKASEGELVRRPRVSEIDNFVATELKRLEGSRFDSAPASPPPIEPLNELFRQELRAVYGDT